MNEHTLKMLEFDKVIEHLKSFAQNEMTKQKIEKLVPHTDLSVIETWLNETSEAKAIIEKSSSVPIANLNGMEHVLKLAEKGISLSPEQLSFIFDLLENVERLQRFMKDKAFLAPNVSSYAYSMFPLPEVKEEIHKCIRNGQVDDNASKSLSKIRKKAGIVEERIKSKLESILKSSSYRNMMQEPLISMRDGRYVIPVKNEYKRNIDGHILDRSSSGATVYMEPQEVRKLQTELNMLKAEEKIEVEKILSGLTAMVATYHRELTITMEAMVHYDFIFAKGKYSRAIHANPVTLNHQHKIEIRAGKHPLLVEKAVPLDFSLGKDYQALIITGPNTGGKTVAIKTVGLLALMVQSGLHVPASKGSEFNVFSSVLVDIGDLQSIEQSLSTFSAHMTNVISIIDEAGPNTLVIMDELGAGTDPAEGMGLAISILEELYRSGAIILATTHYSEMKEFAKNTPGFENGSMEFDVETLRPTYRLIIGKAGQSQAFSIALKLGMESKIIERAHEITYKEVKGYPTETPRQLPIRTGNLQQVREDAIKKAAPVRKKKPQKKQDETSFAIGDRVYVPSLKTGGIICEPENQKGELGVLIKGKKLIVHKKRLKLQIESKELYPDNYDMSIVFETKENRKKAKLMNKRHVEGLTIDRPTDE
ncbi:endonuclease MutS2 [Fictibacillus sp. Mic-4]|uniref:endonuclease MutS2 n=1 Tax=Fictibacillus sp. Mic-4 TaxID=3132826 RepID=UPI003CE9F817